MDHLKVLGVLGGDHMTAAKVATWIEAADLVIAADGGMLRVLEAGYLPDIVIGDFDSISSDMISDEITAVEDKDQNSTDCAKLLNYVKSQGFSHITLVCAEGDLSDHFIDTVHCSVRTDLNVLLGLERGLAYILSGPTSKTVPAEPGRRVSMLPLESIKNASLSGVQWSFEGQELSVRGFTSISNAATESSVNVSFDEGSAYLFIETDALAWLGSKS
jgi:thiamine pyrophosphokinase